MLAIVYIAGVVGSGALLEPVAPDSGLSVAASTLLVAGAFNPLRVRLQLQVDRRFNRSAHDAERAVAAFHARLRDNVQLEALREDLLSTVSGTVQPAGCGWHRGRQRWSSTTSLGTLDHHPTRGHGDDR